MSLLSLGSHVLAEAASPQYRRLVRLYDWAGGQPWSFVGHVEQDREGFLWLTTTSGLYRFDGKRARHFAEPLSVAPGGTAAGRVVAFSPSGRIYEVGREGIQPLEPEPEGPPPLRLTVAVGTDGVAWRLKDGVVARFDSAASWQSIQLPCHPPDSPRAIHPGRNGRMFVTCGPQVILLDGIEPPKPIASVERVWSVIERQDGTIVIGANQAPGPVTTRIFLLTAGGARQIYEERGARLLSLIERGRTIWISTDRGVQALGETFQPLLRVSTPTVTAFGQLLVDHENSLWMATSSGLIQFPEPELFAVLPSAGGYTRDIARAADGLWGSFWGRLAFLQDRPAQSFFESSEPHFSTLCRDTAARVWTSGREGHLRQLEAGGKLGPLQPPIWNPVGCEDNSGPRRWIISSGTDLWMVRATDPRPRQVPFPFGREGLTAVSEAPDGTFWFATENRICSAPAAAIAAGESVTPHCETVPAARQITSIVPMPSGDLWALTVFPGSVRRRAGGKWEEVPGARRLQIEWLNTLTRSPAGGVWITGMGWLARVSERQDLADGWEILEQPTAANGLLSINVIGIAEDPDGTLWLGTDMGLQRIGPELRYRRADPPTIAVVDGSANGTPLTQFHSLTLPAGRNQIDLQFAALTYRDPSSVRFRTRLREDEPWTPATSDGQFTLVGLAPGSYELQVAASLDGLRWSDAPARLTVEIRAPWYAKPWVIVAVLALIALGAHLSFRMRTRRRLLLEQQRTRIAMDLHDEVGSGLGTISVLAGVTAHPDLPQSRRDELAARIVSVSQELSRSLGDIVWSLRTTSGSLDALWEQLQDRARPMFSLGSPRLAIESPDPIPTEALSLVVRRNLHLIVIEALHNAARHAGATAVTLSLAREPRGWRVVVSDDGRGLPNQTATPSTRRGLGIEGMRRRAAEIGGSIEWERNAPTGTRVSIRFSSRGSER